MYELHAVCDDGSGQAWPDHIHSAMCIEAYTIYDITRLSQAWPDISTCKQVRHAHGQTTNKLR